MEIFSVLKTQLDCRIPRNCFSLAAQQPLSVVDYFTFSITTATGQRIASNQRCAYRIPHAKNRSIPQRRNTASTWRSICSPTHPWRTSWKPWTSWKNLSILYRRRIYAMKIMKFSPESDSVRICSQRFVQRNYRRKISHITRGRANMDRCRALVIGRLYGLSSVLLGLNIEYETRDHRGVDYAWLVIVRWQTLISRNRWITAGAY